MAVKVNIEVVGPNARGCFDYVITSGRYRATMERCYRDGCADGSIKPCEREVNDKHMHSSGVGSGSVDKWLAHSATHCHGWHDARVEAFAAKVAKTYGSHKPLTPASATRKSPMPKWPLDKLADELGWSVEDLRDELEKAAA